MLAHQSKCGAKLINGFVNTPNKFAHNREKPGKKLAQSGCAMPIFYFEIKAHIVGFTLIPLIRNNAELLLARMKQKILIHVWLIRIFRYRYAINL